MFDTMKLQGNKTGKSCIPSYSESAISMNDLLDYISKLLNSLVSVHFKGAFTPASFNFG